MLFLSGKMGIAFKLNALLNLTKSKLRKEGKLDLDRQLAVFLTVIIMIIIVGRPTNE